MLNTIAQMEQDLLREMTRPARFERVTFAFGGSVQDFPMLIRYCPDAQTYKEGSGRNRL